jgi:hypothetical protein
LQDQHWPFEYAGLATNEQRLAQERLALGIKSAARRVAIVIAGEYWRATIAVFCRLNCCVGLRIIILPAGEEIRDATPSLRRRLFACLL